jgi:hypothetical protein
MKVDEVLQIEDEDLIFSKIQRKESSVESPGKKISGCLLHTMNVIINIIMYR